MSVPLKCYTDEQMTKVKEQQNKKLDSLIVDKNIQDSTAFRIIQTI